MSTAMTVDTRQTVGHTRAACVTLTLMPTERDEEQASVDEALEREIHHEKTRDAAHEQGEIQKQTREHDLDG
jgi:hypothetical protein